MQKRGQTSLLSVRLTDIPFRQLLFDIVAMRNWWAPNSWEVFLETLRGLTKKGILASTFVKLLTVKTSVQRPFISSFTVN